MSAMQQKWQPADPRLYRAPKDCKFISAEAFLTLAIQAYNAGVRSLVPPAGVRWADDDCTWSNAETFYEALCDQVAERLRRVAVATRDLVEVPWDDDDDEASAGGASMAQGCAAVVPAVGPAHGESTGAARAVPADPLFSGPPGQDLPMPGAVDHTQTQQEASSCV